MMKGKSFINDNRGFTLLELLIGLALTTIVISGLMSIYWLSHNAYIKEQKQADIQYSARQARDHLVKDIRASKKLEVQGAGTWLSLQIESGGSTQKINYYVENNVLYRDNVSVNNKLAVASNIASIRFVSPKPNLVNFTINARSDNQVYFLSSSMSRRVD